MKVKLAIHKEIEVEIKNDNTLIELDNFYRTHEAQEWCCKLEESLTEKATEIIKEEVGIPIFDDNCPEGKECIVGVYAMDGEAILEWW